MTVDAPAIEAPPPDATGSAAEPRQNTVTVSLLVLRWVFLVTVTVFAFRQTLLALAASTRAGSLNGYIWLMPAAAVVAAVGVARRERTELPIHDRQTDIIFGILGLSGALLLQAVLLQRYSLYFHLLRIDLVALWFFLAASCVILFGLRPTVRFVGVWLLLTMSFPVGYQLAVIAFGGNRASAGLASLAVAVVATAVSVGRTRNRAMVGALAALVVGFVVLGLMATLTPNAPLLAFQLIPAFSAMTLAGVSLYFYARRGLRKRVLERKLEPLAARQIWAGIPLITATAVGISLVNLPAGPAPPFEMDGMTFGRPLAAPAGWHQVEQKDFPWVRRVYGRDADLIRQDFIADTGNPKWDKFGRPRYVVVDSTSTWRPFSLQVYPVTVLYDESASRISAPKPVDLGHGITGNLVTVVDDRSFLTYNLLTWTWRNENSAQRVMVTSVDNHEPDVEFPEPNGGFGPTVRTMIAVFFRGNQATLDSDPNFKDLDLLTQFGRGLVAAQVREAEPTP